MYSEGMAVPKDMESIIAGRVHNALYYPPILNLNKLIKPDFGIFRVAEVYKEPIRREIHAALFNGYGIEFRVNDKFKDDELDAFVSIGSILRLEFGEAGINKIVDKKNIKSDVYAKILSSRVLLPVYILILYKDIIFIEAERAAIERILLRGNSGTEHNNLTQQG